MERTVRKKIVESAQTGRLYYIVLESDPDQGIHHLKVYDRNPDVEPTVIRLFGPLKFTLDPPAVEPIIERTLPLHSDIQRRVEELIWRHEQPLLQLERFDSWDGVARYQPPPPQPVQTDPGPVEQEEPAQEDYLIPIRDFQRPGVVRLFNPRTGLSREVIEKPGSLEESG